MVRRTLIPAHRIRVQLFFWTSVLLLVAILGPLELRLRVAAQFLQQDLVDRTTAVVSDVAANLGTTAALEEAEVEEQLLTETVRAPSIIELSVFATDSEGQPRNIASTVNTPDNTLARGPLSLEGYPAVGSHGERIYVLGRDVPNHPGVVVLAVTTLQDLDRFNSLNRSTAFIFTLASIGVAVFILNYIFHRKIGKPLENILTVMAHARVGDYTRRVSEASEDEMGQVASSFNDLLDRVATRDEDLQEKVAKATQDLLDTQGRLIQAEKLATAGQMAATFAHEIGSPLTSLSAHAELLLEDPKTTPHQRDAVALMHKQIRRVTQIVDDLLRSSRRGPDDFVVVNVVEIASDVLKLVLPRLRAQNIQVVSHFPQALHVRGYALYLQEIFLNLINNSAEAIERDGRIELSGGTDQAGKVWMEVRDNGPGVDPRIVHDVWRQFVTSKAMRNGTGLGLAVVREIVKQHGGEVSLKSSSAGTIVRVVLPALKSEVVSL